MPYSRLDYLKSLESGTGTPFPNPLDITSDDSIKFLYDLCLKNELQLTELKPAKLLDKLFSKLIEPELQQPTFVMDHPMCMSPLAKEHRSRPAIAERFELFAGGKFFYFKFDNKKYLVINIRNLHKKLIHSRNGVGQCVH